MLVKKLFKYLNYIKLWFLKAIEYRTELFIWAVLTLLNTTILLTIWMSVFRGVDSVQGYQVGQILQYFLIATIINGVTASHFENTRAREVREGKIDYYMTKPMAYPLQVLLADIGNRLFYITLIIPITLLVYAGFVAFFQLSVPTLTSWTLIQFLFLLVIGYLIEFSFAMSAVFLSFWFEGAEGLEHFKWIIITLFSGFMIPIDFMPSWLRTVVEVLPLKYMYAVPIQIVQQKFSLRLLDLIYIGLFLAGLFIFQHWLWQKAVRKYSSAGG